MLRSTNKKQSTAKKANNTKSTTKRQITTKTIKKNNLKRVKNPIKTSKRHLAVEIPNGQYFVPMPGLPTMEQTPVFHANVNPERPAEYWNYSAFVPAYGNEDNYEISEKLSDGKNSVVMSGFAANSNIELCVKVMMPIAPNKIKRQALALTNLKNLPHVQNLLDICCDKESRTTSFVTLYSPHEPFDQIKDKMTTDDVVVQAFQMFDGLDNIHSKGIIHRNIHPGNVLMNPRGDKKDTCIVDFDNCEFFHPNTVYATKKITKLGWASPEMALGMQDYHYAHDVWGAGMILAQMLFPTSKFFQLQPGQTEIDMIAQIVGSEALAAMIEKYDFYQEIDAETVVPALQAKYKALDFTKLPSKTATPQLIDLLQRVLRADFDERMLPFEVTCLDVFAHLHDDYEEFKNDPSFKYDPDKLPSALPEFKPEQL